MKNNNNPQFTISRYAMIFVGLLVAVIVLIYFFNNSQGPSGDNNSKKIQTTNSAGSDYRTIVKDGIYLTSASRGITVSTENSFNATSFENSISSISKKYFSPKTYLLQEGQYLDGQTIQKWLGRQSEGNPDGLNPSDNGRTDNGRSPYYLQSILEDDFMSQVSDNSVSLRGITIGLAMNRSDSYTKEENGPVFTQEISYDEMVSQGKQIADKVLQRVRATKGIKSNTPILIVMYENSSNDAIVGGNPYAYYMSRSGNKIGNWQNPGIKNVVFPFTDEDTPNVGGQENTQFNNFLNEIKNFLPTLSSATGQGHFENGIMTGINIQVNTVFYSATEIKALTNKIDNILPSYFGSDVPINVSVMGSNEVLAVIRKDPNSSSSISYLFSY